MSLIKRAILTSMMFFLMTGISYGQVNKILSTRIHDPRILWATNPISSVAGVAEGIVISGEYIYVAGYELVGGSDYQCRLEKRNKLDGSLVTSVNYNTSTGGEIEYFGHVIADSQYVYVLGRDWTTNWRAIVQKRRQSDLGLEWQNTYATLGYYYYNYGRPSTDGTSIYVTGTDGTNVLKAKILMGDGSTTWSSVATITSGVGTIYDGTNAYILKSQSGNRYIELLNPTSGAVTSNTDVDDATCSGFLWNGTYSGTTLYVCGHCPAVADTQWMVGAINSATMVYSWYMYYDTVGQNDIARDIAFDGLDLFIVGLINANDGRIEKRNTSGTLIYAVNNTDVLFYNALVVSGDYLWIAGTTSAIIWSIEKRRKSTGVLE